MTFGATVRIIPCWLGRTVTSNDFSWPYWIFGFCIIPHGVLGHNCLIDTVMFALTLTVQRGKDPLRCKQPENININTCIFFPSPHSSLSDLLSLKHLHKAIPWCLKNHHAWSHSHTHGAAVRLTHFPSNIVPYHTYTQTTTKCFKMDLSVQADPCLSSQALSKSLSCHDGLTQIRHSPHKSIWWHTDNKFSW